MQAERGPDASSKSPLEASRPRARQEPQNNFRVFVDAKAIFSEDVLRTSRCHSGRDDAEALLREAGFPGVDGLLAPLAGGCDKFTTCVGVQARHSCGVARVGGAALTLLVACPGLRPLLAAPWHIQAAGRGPELPPPSPAGSAQARPGLGCRGRELWFDKSSVG